MFFSQKLKKFKILNHCFFSKKGGFSKGIYKSLNCGQGSRDLKKNVRKNLALVSKRLNIDFIDVDQEIEKKLGMKIFNIFEKKGEKYFREIEEITTLNILKKNNPFDFRQCY